MALGDYSRLAIGLLHLVLGVATVGMALVLGRRWGLDRRAAALAALLVACDPILLRCSTQVMTETLATFLAVAGLLVLTWAGRPQAGAVGRAVVGRRPSLGPWLRSAGPTFLLWTLAAGVALCLAAAIAGRLTAAGGIAAGPFRRLLLAGYLPAAFFLGAVIVLSPWAIRNQIQFGRPIVTTTHGGYTLLLANNPDFYQWLRSGQWGSVWQADQFNAAWDRRKPADELAADRQAYAEAWQTIRDAAGHVCLRMSGADGPFLVAAAAPARGRRIARRPPFALRRGGLVRGRVPAHGSVPNVSRPSRAGHFSAQSIALHAPLPLPPSLFPLLPGSGACSWSSA